MVSIKMRLKNRDLTQLGAVFLLVLGALSSQADSCFSGVAGKRESSRFSYKDISPYLLEKKDVVTFPSTLHPRPSGRMEYFRHLFKIGWQIKLTWESFVGTEEPMLIRTAIGRIESVTRDSITFRVGRDGRAVVRLNQIREVVIN